MTEEQEIKLLADVKAVTDHMTIVDEILKKARMGRDMRMIFLCGHSGLYFPADYVKDYGRRYGIGLGPDVCSEALDSLYEVAPPAITPDIRRLEQIMHPVANCRAQMDTHLVDASQLKGNMAVLAIDDPDMAVRGPILRDHQMDHPLGRLRLMQVAWERRQ